MNDIEGSNDGDHKDQTQKQPPLKIQEASEDKTWATFCFHNEDHTLGNLLRNVLIKNKDVEFCGYSVPHPNEPFMNVRIHTTGANTKKVLKGGLKRVIKMSDVLTEKFEKAINDFENAK